MMPDALATALEKLGECYLNEPRVCFACRDAPGVMPLVYVVDTRGDGRVHGCVFAVCAVCWCSNDFHDRVSEALRMARAQRYGVWN
jgi:hypothetical protein